MLKKIMLGIVVLALLAGVENLLAQEKEGKPKAKQKQKQAQKGKAKRLHKQKAGKEAAPKRVKALQHKRRQMVAKEAEAKKAKAAAARKRMEKDVRGKPQQFRLRQDRPMQEGSGRLLDELTKAYRENDREKMGQLIRKMHQLRQKVRKARSAPVEARRDFRGRPRLDDVPPSEEVVRPMPPVRGMGGWGRGFQGRGMGGWGRGFRGRGMGGWGRGFPAPWCPWLQGPVPEID